MASTLFVTGVTASNATWANDVDTASYSYLSSVSGTNTITATGPNSMTAYAAGQMFKLVPAATNTGATTVNINAIGAKNVFSGGAACGGGELIISVPSLIVYDGTQFNIVSGAAYSYGTFTPTLLVNGGNTPTYTTQYGKYTKIGNVVHFFVNILLSNKGIATGNLTIGALPFTAASNAAMNVPCAMYASDLAAGVTTAVIALVINNTVTAGLYKFAAGAQTQLDDTAIGNTSNIVVQGTYFTA